MTIFVNPYSRVNFDIPNISLAYAATHFNARVIDFNTDPRKLETVLEHKTDLLGVSVRSLNVKEALRIKDKYLFRFPDTRVVSVGCDIDIQCCYPYRQWNDHLSFGSGFSDEYPFPDYELFDSFPVFHENWIANKWRYSIMTSLGCPFPCEHCMCKSRKWHPRSAENCLEELKLAKRRWGIRSFMILDDCFNVNRKRVIRFSELVRDLDIPWECANGLRADLFDEELAEALAAGGCTQVSFGIESVDDQVLVNMKKAETFAQIKKAVSIATRYFKNVNGFFIIGLPGSSYESDLQGMLWAREVGINAHFTYYVPQDSDLPDDKVFYGDGACSLSDAYPAEIQKKLFEKTAHMRPPEPSGKALL